MSANDIYLIVEQEDGWRVIHTDADDPDYEGRAIFQRKTLEKTIREVDRWGAAEYGYRVVWMEPERGREPELPKEADQVPPAIPLCFRCGLVRYCECDR